MTLPILSKAVLLASLAEGGKVAAFAVVTPNQRLAGALAREVDVRQTARGVTAWETPDILPLTAFVERLYEDALYSDMATSLPLLLSPAQEQALWEDIVRNSDPGRGLLSAPSAAALAREAWKTAQAWRLMPRLKGAPATDDARAFADWAWRYDGATSHDRQCDRARLADVIAPHLAHPALAKPGAVVVYGFDIINPQQRDFFEALAEIGVAVFACDAQTSPATQVCRVAYASAREEILAAARWARQRLEAASTAAGMAEGRAAPLRIGVVVPDLASSRRTVQRLFAQVMAPGHALPVNISPGETNALPFNISLGEPLSAHPLVAAALALLDLARTAISGDIEFPRASSVLRSPFLAAGETELAARARLDAELRKSVGAAVALDPLRRAIARWSTAEREGQRRTTGNAAPAGAGAGTGAGEAGDADTMAERAGCPALVQALAELSRTAKETLTGAKAPGVWARVFSSLLQAAGFPGERTLDSAEYQTLAKWHEAIASFAALDRVAGRMRADEACRRLSRIVADTLFQPEAADVPVQVLGVLESAGLEFDHLWVMGLTDEAWPIPARPNPFIPVALQRAAGVPEAAAATSFELDARITRGWLAAAPEVVFSHPLREEDRELVASPLIRSVPQREAADLALPDYPRLREAIRAARREERIEDARGPAIGGSAVAGGTAVFRDQSACPFRAYALHRLHAEGLATPASGLDAAERGTLVHALLAHVWRTLRSRAALVAKSEEALNALLVEGAVHAIASLNARRHDALEGRYAALEQARLVRLGRAWLALEAEREDFDVVQTEQKRSVSFGGISVNARLDRMDRLARESSSGAGHAVIDYKTGAASPADWLGVRPADPQLPVYAVSVAEKVDAVAYASLKAGDLRFRGIGAEAGLMPGVDTLDKMRAASARDYAGWDALRAGWQRELDALGREFAAGEARVDPRRGELTCRNCGLHALCRITERSGAELDEGDSE